MELCSEGLEYLDDPHEYRVGADVFVSITQALKETGVIPPCPHFKPWHAERGKNVHLACRLLNENRLDFSSVHESLVPYVIGWQKFCFENNYVALSSETPLCSVLTNRTYWFAGTFDTFGECDKVWPLAEIKTGQLPHYTGLQTAGQEILLRANPMIQQLVGTKPIRRISVNLPGDGKYRMRDWQESSDKTVFLSSVAVANWKRRNTCT